MRYRLTLGMSFALVLLFAFSRPASAFNYNVGMFWKQLSTSFSWPFTTGTDASYSFGSSIEISSNVARLKGNDQVDSDNTATGFAGGTLNNVLWDTTNGYMRIGTRGGCDGTSTDCASTIDFSAYEQAVGWAPKYANLVGYWKFNGVGSIATNDTVTAVVGPSLTTSNADASGMAYTAGQLKQGANFDGTDDYAVSASTIDLTGTSAITIGFWLKWNSYANDDKNVLEFGTNFNSGAGRFRISPNDASGKFAVCFRGNGASGGYNCAEFTRPSTGVFHHYAFVLDQGQSSTTEATPYVDGVAVSYTKSNSTQNTGTFANQSLYVMSRAGTSLFGAGVLDDLAIWNTSLTAAEISNIYSTQNPQPKNTAEFDSSWTPKWANILGVWHLNEAAGATTFVDSSGNGRNGTRSGSIVAGATARMSNGAQRTSAGGLIQLPLMATTGNMSFSGWVYWTQTSASGARFFYNGTSGSNGYGLKIESAAGCSAGNKLGIYMGPSTCNAVTGAYTFPTNQWVHVVMTRTTNTWKIYANGTLVDTGTATPITPTGNTNIYYATFEGTLDEVALWSTDLTADDVVTIYNRQSAQYSGTFVSRVMDAFATGMSWTNFSWVPTLPFFKELTDYASSALQNESSSDYSALVGSTGATSDNNLMSSLAALYHMNGSGSLANGSSILDESGNNRTGTIYNGNGTGLTYSPGKLGTSLYFDGVDDEIDVASGLNPWGGDFSFSLWAYPTSKSAVQHNALAAGSAGTNGFRFGIASSDRWKYWTTESGGTVAIGDATVSPPVLNTWQHLAITYKSSTSTTKMYVNGVEVASSTGTFVAPGAGGSIGKYGGYMFAGNLDELAIWGRTLHATEVQQLYRRGANRIKHQVRVCTASDCSDDSTGANWKGPDGTNQTYFSELNNNSAALAMTGDVKKTLPSMLFSDFTSPVGTSRYFQYRTILESDDTGTGCNYDSTATWCSPELKSATVDPTHYDSTAPTIIGQTGVSYSALSNFAETLGASCPSGIGYNLGVGAAYSSATWYWWDAAANAGAGGWAAANGTVTKSNSAATIASHAATFRTQVGAGTIYFKAFLKSSGSTACELDQLTISGQ